MALHDWLDACVDRLDDDLIRFAFADWWEERRELALSIVNDQSTAR